MMTVNRNDDTMINNKLYILNYIYTYIYILYIYI